MWVHRFQLRHQISGLRHRSALPDPVYLLGETVQRLLGQRHEHRVGLEPIRCNTAQQGLQRMAQIPDGLNPGHARTALERVQVTVQLHRRLFVIRVVFPIPQPIIQLIQQFLRLLQEGEYRPVGSEITRKADLRFIAATNHDLKTEIKENRFREDLYYRLNVILFHLPPLRERKQDIPIISFHFLKKYTRLYQKDVTDISPAAMQALMLHDFPGNIRELENIIERAVILSRTNSLTISDLALDNEQAAFLSDTDQDVLHLSFKEAKDKMIHMFHRHYIQTLLSQNAGNISRAAQTAGIQRQYLHRLMKETGIDADDFRSKESA